MTRPFSLPSPSDAAGRNAPARRGWWAWVLRLTGALDALLEIGVALSEKIADRAEAELPKGRTRHAEAWVRLARLMQRTALLCLWLEEGHRPPRFGDMPAPPPAAPSASPRPSAPPASAPALPAPDAAPRRRRRDGWYARMRTEFARRPMEDFLARLHRALSDAARRAGVPEAMAQVEDLLDRARRLLAAMPGTPGARRPDGAWDRWPGPPEAAWVPGSAGGATFCG